MVFFSFFLFIRILIFKDGICDFFIDYSTFFLLCLSMMIFWLGGRGDQFFLVTSVFFTQSLVVWKFYFFFCGVPAMMK